MNEFIKVPELSGRQKAAILITELGSFNTDKVLSYLSDSEVERLLSAVGMLGKVSIGDEIRVLSELNDFGVRRGISKPIRSDAEIRAEMNAEKHNIKNNELREFINQNPDAIANALSAWMRED